MSNPITKKRPLTIADYDNIKKCLDVEKQQETFRQLREKECYPIINRGEAWYKRLTDEQKAELDSWYQSWLDITDTLILPIKPNWLR